MTTDLTTDSGRDDTLPYRPCVGIALFERSGRVFVGRRRSKGEALAQSWQMPQGGIDEGETPREAAIRELYEETNVPRDAVAFLGETPGWLTYDLPPELTKPAWKGRYRGQTQRWLAFGFLGEDALIDVDRPGGGRHKPEFDAWRWEDLAVTPTLIVPFKRPVYESVARSFADLVHWRAAA